MRHDNSTYPVAPRELGPFVDVRLASIRLGCTGQTVKNRAMPLRCLYRWEPRESGSIRTGGRGDAPPDAGTLCVPESSLSALEAAARPKGERSRSVLERLDAIEARLAAIEERQAAIANRVSVLAVELDVEFEYDALDREAGEL